MPRAPVLGVASISLPVVTAALWFFFERNPSHGDALNGFLGLFLLAFLYVGTLILMGGGFILGVAALARRESGKVLGILGILMNIAVILRLSR